VAGYCTHGVHPKVDTCIDCEIDKAEERATAAERKRCIGICESAAAVKLRAANAAMEHWASVDECEHRAAAMALLAVAEMIDKG
jgi:hypothetical protein